MFAVQASQVPKDVYVTNETTGLFRLRSLDVAKTLVVAEQQVFVLKVSSIGKEVSDLKEGVWELFFLL